MTDIRDQKLLYHLTNIKNIDSILKRGLMPRSQLSKFTDIADHGIIEHRQRLNLENFVPFHFFAKNPFDGRVQTDHPGEKFALIAVGRSFAQANSWKIIPRHPLAGGDIELMDYDAGFSAIDWEIMNSRDYHNPNCKSVCMAECLSPTTVRLIDFFSIYVSCQQSLESVQAQLVRIKSNCRVNLNPNMFHRDL